MEFGSWNHIIHCFSAGLLLAPALLLTVWACFELTFNLFSSIIRLMRGDA